MLQRSISGRHFALLACALLSFTGLPFPAGTTAAAARLDDVEMPETLQFEGVPLRLNGMGMRDYSLFHVHIYAAGLYLEQPSSDWQAILHSEGAKLLVIRFVHDVTATQARDAWAKGFKTNCQEPCRLRGEDVTNFLAQVPDFRRGDESTMLFARHTAQIAVNGRVMGTVTDGDLARTILATFIGADPPTQMLKRGLLGLPD
jgi:hypothetical protein